MACQFILKVNNVTNPRIKTQFALGFGQDSNAVYSIQQLYDDLSKLPKSDLDALVEAIDEAFANKPVSSEFKPLRDSQSRVVVHTFAEHMRNLGVQVQEDNLGNSGPSAFVQDGVIHINMDLEVTTAPMHELLHLVLEYMKVTDFDSFRNMMYKLDDSPEFTNLYTEICKNPQYQNMMELDKKAESFCRMFEELLYDVANKHQFKLETLPYDEINKTLTPFISEVFGIEKVPDLLNFLMSTVSDLPVQGSTLFLRPKLATTGYSDYKSQIALAGRVTNLISDLVARGAIKEEGCV